MNSAQVAIAQRERPLRDAEALCRALEALAPRGETDLAAKSRERLCWHEGHTTQTARELWARESCDF